MPGWATVTEVHVNGLRLHVEVQGSGPSLMLLHGFTGSARSWEGVTDILCQTHRVVAIDVIGHGQSDAPQDTARYAYNRALDDLACLAATLGVEQAAWLGYSMGGRLALGLARRHPERVGALILESTSPGLADPLERERRRGSDDALAKRIEEHGVDAFVAAWERLPLWESQARLAPEVLQRQRDIRLSNTPAGLAGSLRGMGTGAQPSFWGDLGSVKAPTLIIAGSLDDKFTRIARRMAEVIPRANLNIMPDAGHAVHLEQPERFADAVRNFISRQ